MSEMLFIASGMRLPIVMAVANRSLSAPLSIWNDQSDSMAQRDSGWIQLYCESVQEAYDTTIQAFRIAEKTSLPVMICIDGFTISHVFEPIKMLDDDSVGKFVGKFKPKIQLDVSNPITMGPITMPDSHMAFKKIQSDAILEAKKEIKKINSDFADEFGINHGDGLIEAYKMEDAEVALLGMGSLCSTARVAVDEMRSNGKKVGLIKVKSFRPFPSEELKKITEKLKGIAVIDRAISMGNTGPLFTEVKASIKNIQMNDFITALGGRDINVKMLSSAVEKIGQKNEVEWLF
jgi:pyruvate ferredoxin oxidoreductase alpha subunit